MNTQTGNIERKHFQKGKIALTVLSITLFALVPAAFGNSIPEQGQFNDTISVSSNDLTVTTYYGIGCGRTVLVDLRMTYGELRNLMSFGGQNNSGVGEWMACHPYGDGLYWNVLDNKRLWVASSEIPSTVTTTTTYIIQGLAENNPQVFPDAKLELLEQPALSAPATWFFVIVIVIVGLGGFAIGFLADNSGRSTTKFTFDISKAGKIEIDLKNQKITTTDVTKEAS